MNQNMASTSGSSLDEFILNANSITGPMSMSCSQVNGRLLLLFGDYHASTDEKCWLESGSVKIEKFLEKLFLQANVCVDFLLEIGYFDRIPVPTPASRVRRLPPTNSNQGEIVETARRFEQCFFQRECPFDRVRFHLVDVRSPPSSIFSIPVLRERFGDSTEFWENRDQLRNILLALMEDRLDIVSSIFQDLFRNDPELFLAYSEPELARFSSYPKIAQQLRDNPLANEIKTFLLQGWDEMVSSIVSTNSPDIWIQKLILQFGAFVMDIYTLGRLTKILYLYSDSRLVIAYAGDEHIERYRSFFDQRSWKFGTSLFSVSDPEYSKTCIRFPIEARHILIDALHQLSPSICTRKNLNLDPIFGPWNVFSVIGMVGIHGIQTETSAILGWQFGPGNQCSINSMTISSYLDSLLRSSDKSTLFLSPFSQVKTRSLFNFYSAFISGSNPNYPHTEFRSINLDCLSTKDQVRLQMNPNIISDYQRYQRLVTDHVQMIAPTLNHDLRLLSAIFEDVYEENFDDSFSLPFYVEISRIWPTMENQDFWLAYFQRHLRTRLAMDRYVLFRTKPTVKYIFDIMKSFWNDVYILIFALTVAKGYQRIFITLENLRLLSDLNQFPVLIHLHTEQYNPYAERGCLLIPFTEQERLSSMI